MTCLDLFSGIGGIRLGFEQAFGALETLASEIDPAALRVYEANFRAAELGDVRELDPPSVDLALAGFPCQPFSIAGARRGFDDPRGGLFGEVLRICKVAKPRAIFLENVPGLLTHKGGATFRVVWKSLQEIDYRVFWKVLNSRDFGLAQNRPRLYAVAFRDDLQVGEFAFPVGSARACLSEILETDPDPRCFLSEKALAGMERRRARNKERGSGFGLKVLRGQDVAHALVCGGMGHERNIIADPRALKLRKLTVREWARLQGFPDSFKLPGGRTALYRLLAASVSVPVVRAVATEIRSTLKKYGIRK